MTQAERTAAILEEAAKDVDKGMWCKGSWFKTIPDDDIDLPEELDVSVAYSQFLRQELSLEALGQMERCAEGSIAFAALMLGEPEGMAIRAMTAVGEVLPGWCEHCRRFLDRLHEAQAVSLADHNDRHLPDDPSEAGKFLAELFRHAAEKELERG